MDQGLKYSSGKLNAIAAVHPEPFRILLMSEQPEHADT
jgi:hypothetical protein